MRDKGEVLKIGGLLSGQKLTVTDRLVTWADVYGKGFSVPRSQISGISVERTGWGKATFRVVGQGTMLAEVPKLPQPWAEQAQAWLMEKLGL